MTRPHLILAPLRGFTDLVFRNTFQRHFGGIDEAIAPFVASIKGRRIKPSHLRDLNPHGNRTMPVVPQILSNNSDEFICLAKALVDLGYGEINWNLGCPYPMVVKKMRGSGLLPFPDTIDRLLSEISRHLPAGLSIKTRLGRYAATEIEALIPIFNRYPLIRVIVHPRVGEQMYAGRVDLNAFESCLARLAHPVVYNGDINDAERFFHLQSKYSAVSGWMLGRGLIANPFLAEQIKGQAVSMADRNDRFKLFHDDLVDNYSRLFSGPGHVLDRMKGFWRYFADGFDDHRGILKRVRKTTSLERYQALIADFLSGIE